MATLSEFYANLPNLRNGDADGYNILHVAAGIPASYYFLNFTTAVPGDNVIRARVCLDAAVYQSRMAATGMDANEAKAQGIVLAAVRAGMMKSWDLNAGNASAAQRVDIGVGVWDGAQATPADRYVEAGLQARVNGYDADYVSDAMISSLMQIGMGVFVCCGVIMVRTEGLHHFVGELKAISVALGKQVFGARFEAPFGLDMTTFEDVAYHKAPHCWISDLMITAARSNETRVRLLAAKLAAAAVRVPAKYPAESGAGAISNLVKKTQTAGRLANVAVDADRIVAICDAVTVGTMATAAMRAESTRALAELIEVHSSDIAICIGLFRGICSHAGVRDPGILRAKCLVRIAADDPVMVSTGVQQMEAAIRVQREKSRRGILRGIGLFGADAPEDTEALPADETMAQILAAVVGRAAAAGAVP